jgi:5-methylcytosine-specific restriction enzyme subunit McrC
MQYVEREDNLGTVRGRVLPLDNIRQNAFAPHRLYCRFEEFSPDRPENRLIRSALAALVRGCSDSLNRHRASMLAERLHEIPPSLDVRADLARWRDDRLMKHYRELRSTCRWILLRQGISPVRGGEGMVGCFARMNDVFERYVARWIARELGRHDELKHLRLFDQTLREKPGGSVSRELWQWENDKHWTYMLPDMAIYDAQKCVAVLDAKWKLPKTQDINRSDIYQVHAYARYWLSAGGQVALIYPHLNGGEPVAQKAFRFVGLDGLLGHKLFFNLPSDEGGGAEEGLGLLEPLRAIGARSGRSTSAADRVCQAPTM